MSLLIENCREKSEHSYEWLSDEFVCIYCYQRAFDEPQPQFSSNESRKSKLPVNYENLARKLTSSIKNKFMMQTQIH